MRNLAKISIRGVPLLPLLAAAIIGVSATLVAFQTVNQSITITASFSIRLVTEVGGVCTTTPYTAEAWPSTTASSQVVDTGTQFCIQNTSNSNVWVGGSGALTVSSGSPAGSTEALLQNGAATSATIQIAPGASSLGYNLQLTVAAGTLAGTYTWTVNVNAYDNSGGT